MSLSGLDVNLGLLLLFLYCLAYNYMQTNRIMCTSSYIAYIVDLWVVDGGRTHPKHTSVKPNLLMCCDRNKVKRKAF